MAKLTYKINGTVIKSPPIPCDIEKYNITNAGRTGDGQMKLELIAKKRKFILRYPVMSAPEKKVIESLIDSSSLFFNFEYIEDNIKKSAKCYVGAMKWTPAWHDHGYWYWRDIELSFIEQ